MPTAPSEPGTGNGYSPPARKLAVSPDIATRFGSASVRATPFCSSALIRTSMVVPPVIRRPNRKPKGEAFDRTPAATSPIGILVGLVGAVIGSPGTVPLASLREPIFAVTLLLNMFH